MSKKCFCALLVGVCSLLGSVHAHAERGWVQLPGAAKQIAVGASDFPVILDTNGYLQYLAAPTLACGSGICVNAPRQWSFSQRQFQDGFGVDSVPPVPMSLVSVDLYGYTWSLDQGGGLWIGLGNSVDGTVLTQNGTRFGTCATSMAPDIMQNVPNEWNRAFPNKVDYFNFNGGVSRNYAPLYTTGCNSSSLLSANIVFNGTIVDEQPYWTYGSSGFGQIDTGESQVSLFTLLGSNTRVPWIVAPLSSGRTTAWAYFNGSFIAAPLPVGDEVYDITYITDGYAVAGNRTWFWNGNADGSHSYPTWFELQNSTPSDGATIRQIAAAATAYTRDGDIGPSNLYMVDSFDRVFVYDELPGPVE